MLDNYKNLKQHVQLMIHPALEFLSAIVQMSQEDILKEKLEGFHYQAPEEFFLRVKQLNIQTSRYLKQESHFFFAGGTGIGYIIWVKLVADHLEVKKVDELLEILSAIDPKDLIYMALSQKDEIYSNDILKLMEQIKSSKTLEENEKEVLMELIENPIEFKQRFYLVMSQFYKKCYQDLEPVILNELEQEKEKIEKQFNDNPNDFFKKRFHMELKEQNQVIRIHTSYFRQIGFNYLEMNNEVMIIMGINSDYLNEDKVMKDKITKFLKILSDKKRMEILIHLNKRPWYVNELGDQLGLTAPTISYHMNFLMELDLVYFERDDHRLYYSLNKNKISELFDETKYLILEER